MAASSASVSAKAPRWDTTAIAFTGNDGEQLFGRGLVGATGWSDPSAHVPLILRDPRPAAQLRLRHRHGQQEGAWWRRALRSRDVWAEVVAPAGIGVLRRGLLIVAGRPEARVRAGGVLADRDGQDCRVLEPAEMAARYDDPRTGTTPFAL